MKMSKMISSSKILAMRKIVLQRYLSKDSDQNSKSTRVRRMIRMMMVMIHLLRTLRVECRLLLTSLHFLKSLMFKRREQSSHPLVHW